MAVIKSSSQIIEPSKPITEITPESVIYSHIVKTAILLKLYLKIFLNTC